MTHYNWLHLGVEWVVGGLLSVVSALLGLGYVLVIPVIGTAMLVIALFEKLVKTVRHAHVETLHRPAGRGRNATTLNPFRSIHRHRAAV